MDTEVYFKFVLALVFVVALIAVIGWLARRMGLGGAPIRRGRRRRLAIVEMLALDSKRRLVLVRRDDREHLLVIGGQSDLAIERNIPVPPDPAEEAAR